MDGFHHLLTLPEPIKALFVQGDDDKLTAMHQMQRSICEAILLYADKVYCLFFLVKSNLLQWRFDLQYIVIVDDSNRSARSDERPVIYVVWSPEDAIQRLRYRGRVVSDTS